MTFAIISIVAPINLESGKMDNFWSNSLGDLVIGEMCQCGHPQKSHGSTTKMISEEITVRFPHKGGCYDENGCCCEKFTFARWIKLQDVLEEINLAEFDINMDDAKIQSDSHYELEIQ